MQASLLSEVSGFLASVGFWTYPWSIRADAMMCLCPQLSKVLLGVWEAFPKMRTQRETGKVNSSTTCSFAPAIFPCWKWCIPFYHRCFICPINSQFSIFSSMAWLYLRQLVPADRLIRRHFLSKFCSSIFLLTFIIRAIEFSLSTAWMHA